MENLGKRQKLSEKRKNKLNFIVREISKTGSQMDVETEISYRERIGLLRVDNDRKTKAGMVSYKSLRLLFNILNQGCNQCSLKDRFSTIECNGMYTNGVTLCCKFVCCYNFKHSVAGEVAGSTVGFLGNTWYGSKRLSRGRLELTKGFVLTCLTAGLLPIQVRVCVCVCMCM